MRIYQLLINLVSPSLLIPKPEWQTLWRMEERRRFQRLARFFTLGMGLLFASHFFLIDIPHGKTPLVAYAWYRFSVAGLGLAIFALCQSKWYSRWKVYQLPVLVFGGYMVYMQAQSMVWSGQVPFFYVPLLATVTALVVRWPVLGTLVAYSLLLLCGYDGFFARPQLTYHMVSASLVGAMLLVVFRSRLKSELDSFILGQRHLEAQKQLIESQLALTDQLRAFLPRELFRRAEIMMQTQRMTPLQALDEIQRSRKVLAAVLFSDIRGFTGLTKQGDDAIIRATIPAQKMCTDVIEEHSGIPRLQGDLVFSYFDEPDPVANIRQAVKAALKLYYVTERLNARNDNGLQIRRYVIVTFGPVIVGNIGGTEGSKDINVLGDSANLPSRIDGLTKEKSLAALMNRHPIILSAEAFEALSRLHEDLDVAEVKLANYGLSLRDFPEEGTLYFLWSSERNRTLLEQPGNSTSTLEYLERRYRQRMEPQSISLVEPVLRTAA